MSYRNSLLAVVLCLLSAGSTVAAEPAPLALDQYRSFDGCIDTWWDEGTGRMLVRVEEFNRRMADG